jgi:hypothetical protein
MEAPGDSKHKKKNGPANIHTLLITITRKSGTSGLYLIEIAGNLHQTLKSSGQYPFQER